MLQIIKTSLVYFKRGFQYPIELVPQYGRKWVLWAIYDHLLDCIEYHEVPIWFISTLGSLFGFLFA